MTYIICLLASPLFISWEWQEKQEPEKSVIEEMNGNGIIGVRLNNYDDYIRVSGYYKLGIA